MWFSYMLTSLEWCISKERSIITDLIWYLLFLGLRHHLVWLHHHHPQLQTAGRHYLLFPEPVRVGLLHPAADGSHDRVPHRADRRLGDGQLCSSTSGGDGVLWVVHLCIHSLPHRQPAAQPEGVGGVPGIPLLLRDWVDHPDVLAVTVGERLKDLFLGAKRLKKTPASAFDERLLIWEGFRALSGEALSQIWRIHSHSPVCFRAAVNNKQLNMWGCK